MGGMSPSNMRFWIRIVGQGDVQGNGVGAQQAGVAQGSGVVGQYGGIGGVTSYGCAVLLGLLIYYLSSANIDGTDEYYERLGWKRLQDYNPAQRRWKHLKDLAQGKMVHEDTLLFEDELQDEDYFPSLPFAIIFSYFKGKRNVTFGAKGHLWSSVVREDEEDYVIINLKRPMKMHTTLEYHASCIYTKEMFKKFQDELVESSEYFVEKDRRACEEGKIMGDVYTYCSCYRPISQPTRRNVYFVAFEKVSFLGMCMCRMFEYSGLPCRHLLAVFTKKQFS
ncbi:hypothetical protein AgCh_011898 [Apium graveolens]